MLRAAAGSGPAVRAGRSQDRFGGVYGATSCSLVGAGNNGGDALYAGALLARRGVVVRALLLDPAPAHAGGLAALRAAGGRVVADVPSAVDLALDGIVGIGGHGPLRPPAAAAMDDLSRVRSSDGDRPTSSRSTCPRGVDADTGAVDDATLAVAADVTVTFGCLKPALRRGRRGPVGRFRRARRHRARPVPAGPSDAAGADRGRHRRLVAGAGRGLGQVHPRRGRARHRLRGLPRRRRALGVAGALGRPGRAGPLRRRGGDRTSATGTPP